MSSDNTYVPGDPNLPSELRSDNERRIDVLRLVAFHGGTLNPRRNPYAKLGHDFGDVDMGHEQDLKFLADRDYLEARFFDRISLCTKCNSHHLNIREVCPTCRSTNFQEDPLLHHFRCAFVGRVSEFEAKDGSGKRICPKCNYQLKYLGTDHDHLGKTCLCLDCGTSFQEAPASGVCLVCSTETAAADLSSADISGYSITSLGSAAIRRGSLFETESEFLFFGGLPVYRPSVAREIFRHEAKRAQRFKSEFTALFIQFNDATELSPDDKPIGQFLQQLRDRLRGPDILGQIDNTTMALCMPQTPAVGAQVVESRLIAEAAQRDLRIATSIAVIAKPEDLTAAFQALKPTPSGR